MKRSVQALTALRPFQMWAEHRPESQAILTTVRPDRREEVYADDEMTTRIATVDGHYWLHSEPYWIAGNMVNVLAAASSSIPPEAAVDPPTIAGLCLLEK